MSEDASDFFEQAQAQVLSGLGERVFRTRLRPDDVELTPEQAAAGRGPGGPVYLGSFPSNTAPWHALRKKGLGGSEIGQVVGLSKYGSAFTLWHAKRSTEEPEDISGKPAIEWGHRLEPVVGAKLIENHPELALAPQVGTFTHSERTWQVCNPDLLGPTAIGEVKTAGYDYAWGEAGTGEIPLSYRAQVTWYMDVMHLDVAHICVLISGRDYREYVVEYDLADALWMRAAGADFMASLADGVEPEPSGTEADLVMAGSSEEVTDLDVQISPELAAEYEVAVRAYEVAETAKKAASAKVLAAIGDARRAVCGTLAIAARQRSRYGTVYLKVDGKLLHSKPVGLVEPTIVAASTAHSSGDLNERIDWLLGRCVRRTDVETLVSLLSPVLSDDSRARCSARWRELH